MQNSSKPSTGSHQSTQTTPTLPNHPSSFAYWSDSMMTVSDPEGVATLQQRHRERLRLLPEAHARAAAAATANYGSTNSNVESGSHRRSLSVPSDSLRGNNRFQGGGQNSASRNPERQVQRAAAQAYAKSAFFHGKFTSSHGLTVTRASPRTPALLPAKRGSPQLGPRRAAPSLSATAALLRPPPTVVAVVPLQRGMHRRRSLSAGAMDRAMDIEDSSITTGAKTAHAVAGPTSPLTAPSTVTAGGSGFPGTPLLTGSFANGSFVHPPVPVGTPASLSAGGTATPASLAAQQTQVYAEERPMTPMTPHMLPPPVNIVMISAAMDPALSNKKAPHDPCVEQRRPTAGDSSATHGGCAAAVVALDADEVVSWVDAMLELIPLALPSMVSMMLTYALTAVPLAFIGTFHGQVELSGASVGYFILSICAQYPITGLTFALDTLCSMEYGRDPNSTLQGVLLQRAILVNLAFLFPVCTLLYSTEGFLSLIYDDEIAAIAARYLRFSPFFLFPLVCFTAFSKFCANQLLPQMPMIAMVVGVIATPVVQRWCVPLGVEGAMLGMGVSAWIQLSVIFALTLGHKQTRATLGELRIEQAASFADLKAYLKLALPSALFVAAEASAFDMSVLLAAKIGNPEGAAWSAILNSLLFFVAAAGGLSASAAAKVGASLGAGYPEDARRYAFAAVFLATCICLMNSVVIYSFFDVLLSLFGTTGISLRAGLAVRWLAPFLHIADSIQFCFQGVFSGAGQNHKGALILLSCLWAFGFPLSLILAFYHGLGLQGVVGGLTIGLFVEIPFMTYYVQTMDWQALADEAQQEDDEVEEEEEEEDEEEVKEEQEGVEMRPL